jgi:hypothetical protein
MARPLRLEFPVTFYHVTSRGNARQAIVLGDEDRALFLACFGEVVSRFDRICHAMFRNPHHQDDAQAMSNVPYKRSSFPARYLMGQIFIRMRQEVFEAEARVFFSGSQDAL